MQDMRIQMSSILNIIKRDRVIILIILVAAIIRFIGITHNLGLQIGDEMGYLWHIMYLPEKVLLHLILDLYPYLPIDFQTFFPFVVGIITMPLKALHHFAIFPNYDLKHLIYLTGRFVSAIFGIATVYLVYYIGKQEYSCNTGILAALLLTFSSSHVVFSHWGEPHVFAGFLATIAIYLYIQISKKPSTKRYLLSGIITGLSIATYHLTSLLVIPFLFTHLYVCYRRYNESKCLKLKESFAPINFIIFFVSIAICFVIATPYILIDFDTWFNRVFGAGVSGRYITGSPIGNIEINHILGVFPMISESSVQGIGIPMVIIILLGLLYAFKRHRYTDLLLASFVIPFFVIVGNWDVRGGGYFIPFLPVSIILASHFIIDLFYGMQKKRFVAVKKVLAGLLILCVITYSALFTLAFLNLMAGTDTREASAEWIHDNIPRGSTIGLKFKGSRGFSPALPYINHSEYNATYYSDYPDYAVLNEHVNPFFKTLLKSKNLVNYTWTGKRYKKIPPETWMFFDDVLNEKQQKFKYKLVAKFEKNPHFLGFKLKKSGCGLSPTIYIYSKS